MQKLSSLCQKINKVNPSFFAFVRFYRISLSRFGQLHQRAVKLRHSGRHAPAAQHRPALPRSTVPARQTAPAAGRVCRLLPPTARTHSWAAPAQATQASAADPAAHRVRPFSGFWRFCGAQVQGCSAATVLQRLPHRYGGRPARVCPVELLLHKAHQHVPVEQHAAHHRRIYISPPVGFFQPEEVSQQRPSVLATPRRCTPEKMDPSTKAARCRPPGPPPTARQETARKHTAPAKCRALRPEGVKTTRLRTVSAFPAQCRPMKHCGQRHRAPMPH